MDLFAQPTVFHLGEWTIVDRGPELDDCRFASFHRKWDVARMEPVDKGGAVYLRYDVPGYGLIDCDGYGATPEEAVEHGEAYIRETDEEFGDDQDETNA